MSRTYETTRRVEFADTDMAGIVHFANFFRWMEQVEHEYLRSLGLNVMQTVDPATVIGWPRVSATCNYEAPAYHEDVLDVKLNVDRIGVKSLTMSFEFTKDGKPVARGQMKTACCLCRHDQPLESIVIPAEFIAALDPNGESGHPNA